MIWSWSAFIFVPRIFPQPTTQTMMSHSHPESSPPGSISTSPASCLLCLPSPLYPSRLLTSLQYSLLNQIFFGQFYLPNRAFNFGQFGLLGFHLIYLLSLLFLICVSHIFSFSFIVKKKKKYGSRYLKSSSLSF